MTKTHYLNAHAWGNKIYYRGIRNGVRVKEKITYGPTLYLRHGGTEDTGFRTIHGRSVKPVTFDTIKEAKEFAEGQDAYGYDRFAYTYLAENFMDDIAYDAERVRVAWLDIETDMEGGASPVTEAEREITLITVKIDGRIFTFGCGAYTPHKENVVYTQCRTETEMLRRFLRFWNKDDYCPDIVSGWNISGYDIPYMVNRINKVLGEGESSRLSPWSILHKKRIVSMGKDIEVEYPVGIAVLDYLDLYKKMTVGVVDTPDDYKLNTIAHNELNVGKLDYSHFENLLGLQKNDWQKYCEYNIIDVELVEQIDTKRKLIDLTIAMAYTARCNFEDVLGTVKQWETLLHHDLLRQGIVVPPRRKSTKKDLIGAFVKEPVVGSYNWMVSFDATSLYPSLQMHFNISLESRLSDKERAQLREKVTGDAVRVIDFDFVEEDLLEKRLDLSFLKDHDLTMTANGQLYRRNPPGVMPSILEKIFDSRVVAKKAMADAEKRYEKDKDPADKALVTFYNLRQQCAKILMNSGYGALSNVAFMFFEHENAEAITMSGQLCIKWIAKKFNELLNRTLKTVDVDYVAMVDTDSNYLNLGDLVKKYIPPGTSDDEIATRLDKLIKAKIDPYINQSFDELSDYLNSAKRKLFMKREAISSRAIVIGKKYYILNVLDNEGVRYKEPKVKLKGIAAVKSSTPSSCREKIKQAIKLILTKGEQDVMDFIHEFRKEFRKLPFEDIAFPRSIKGMDKFRDDATLCKKGTPIQVRAALIYNEMLDRHGLVNLPRIYDGDKIKYAYCRLPNLMRENVIGTPGPLPKSFEIEKVLDYETMFEKAFETPLKSIMDAVGWKMVEENTLF